MANEVEFFGQRMTEDWAEMLRQTQLKTHFEDAEGRYARIPYGSEAFRVPVEAGDTPCRHCSTIYGKLHEPFCNYEQCPRCNWQLMSCGCEFFDR